MRFSVSTLWLLSITCCVPHTASARATIYNLIDLGTLGGNSSNATAINDQGTVVGYSQLVDGGTRAFRWTVFDEMQNLGSVQGGDSKALDINGSDHVVGVSDNRAFR